MKNMFVKASAEVIEMICWRNACERPDGIAVVGENVTWKVHVPPGAMTVPTVQVFAETTKSAELAGAIATVRFAAELLATVTVRAVDELPTTTDPKSSLEGAEKKKVEAFDQPRTVVVSVAEPSVTRHWPLRISKAPHALPAGGLCRTVTVQLEPAASGPEQVVAVMSQNSVVLPV
jgi:hypothetical protein